MATDRARSAPGRRWSRPRRASPRPRPRRARRRLAQAVRHADGLAIVAVWTAPTTAGPAAPARPRRRSGAAAWVAHEQRVAVDGPCWRQIPAGPPRRGSRPARSPAPHRDSAWCGGSRPDEDLHGQADGLPGGSGAAHRGPRRRRHRRPPLVAPFGAHRAESDLRTGWPGGQQHAGPRRSERLAEEPRARLPGRQLARAAPDRRNNRCRRCRPRLPNGSTGSAPSPRRPAARQPTRSGAARSGTRKYSGAVTIVLQVELRNAPDQEGDVQSALARGSRCGRCSSR